MLPSQERPHVKPYGGPSKFAQCFACTKMGHKKIACPERLQPASLPSAGPPVAVEAKSSIVSALNRQIPSELKSLDSVAVSVNSAPPPTCDAARCAHCCVLLKALETVTATNVRITSLNELLTLSLQRTVDQIAQLSQPSSRRDSRASEPAPEAKRAPELAVEEKTHLKAPLAAEPGIAVDSKEQGAKDDEEEERAPEVRAEEEEEEEEKEIPAAAEPKPEIPAAVEPKTEIPAAVEPKTEIPAAADANAEQSETEFQQAGKRSRRNKKKKDKKKQKQKQAQANEAPDRSPSVLSVIWSRESPNPVIGAALRDQMGLDPDKHPELLGVELLSDGSLSVVMGGGDTPPKWSPTGNFVLNGCCVEGGKEKIETADDDFP